MEANLNKHARFFWCCLLALSLCTLFTTFTLAQSKLDKSPLSGGLLAAKAFKEGRIHFQPATTLGHSPDLTCSPAPCAFPNVDASEGTSAPVNEHPIAANPNNAQQMLTGGNDYNCGNIQGFFATNDGGSTWNHVCSPGTGGEGDPVVGYDLNNVAYAGGIQSGSIVDFISTDNGAHWGSPIKVIGAQLGYTADKPWMEIDVNPASPLKNAIYVSSTQFSSASDSQIWVSHSTDGGHTWTSKAIDPLQHYPTFVDQFSDIAIGSDGAVYVTWIRCPANGPTGDCGSTKTNVLLSKSTDGGNTWSNAVTVAQITMVPDSCGAFYGCLPNTFERVSNIPANAATGSGNTTKVYVNFYNWTGTQMQSLVATSTNGGSTFGAPVRVTTSTKGDEFFTWINLAKNGRIGVTWLDRRNDPANVSYQPFFAFSTNGGATFSASHALSTTKSNPNSDGFGGSFMGDYRTHVWNGKAVYADWMDTRTGTSQDEIGGVQF